MIPELLFVTWVFNSISKDICDCIDAYNEEQKEMQSRIIKSENELDELTTE